MSLPQASQARRPRSRRAPAARHLSPERAEITLLAKDDQFRFVPSFPWVAMGRRCLEQVSFPLAGPLAARNVRFARATVTHIGTGAKVVSTEAGEHPYEFLVVATGHRSANEAVPGLGPFDGSGHSPMSARETEELAQAIQRLLAEPGPVVIGAAPGASCIGPVYELAFELEGSRPTARAIARSPSPSPCSSAISARFSSVSL